jgi:hypothetical protein
MLNTTDSFYFSNKPTDQERWVTSNDQKNNTQYEGVVQAISPLGYLNGNCVVYIPNLRMYVKCQTNFGYNSHFVGNTVAYRPGDFVRVSFVNGKTERPTIIGSLSNHRSEGYMLKEGNPIPQHWTEDNELSYTVTPNAYIPEAARWGYRVTGQVYDYPGLITKNKDTNLFTEIPGTAIWDMHGDYHIYPLGTLNIAATKLNFKITAPRVDPALYPLETLRAHMMYYGDYEGKNTRKYIKNNSKLSYDKILDVTIDYVADKTLQPDSEVKQALADAAKEEVKSILHLEACVDRNRNMAQSLFSKIFGALAGGLLGDIGNIIDVGDELLNQILNAGLSWAMQEVNGILPDWAQLSVQNGAIGIGPLSIDPVTGNVGINGGVFNAIVGKQLDSVNKALPSWLQIRISGNIFSFGGKNIPLEDLMQDGLSIGIGDFVIRNDKGNITMSVDGLVVGDLTQAVTAMATNIGIGFISGGLAELNQNLPDEFQIGVSMGADGLPTFSVGPLSITPFGNNAGISLDKAALGQALESLLGGLLEQFLSQLPLPLQWIGRVLWNEINFGALFMDAPKEPYGNANEVEGIIRSGRYTCVSGPIDFINAPVTISPLPPPSQFEVDTSGENNLPVQQPAAGGQ